MLAGFASTEAGFGSDRPGDVGETGAAVGGLVNTSRPSPAANAEQVRLKRNRPAIYLISQIISQKSCFAG